MGPASWRYNPWEVLEAAVMAIATHQVLTGSLVDDSTFTSAGAGTASYDLVTIDNRTFENDHDTVRNNQPGTDEPAPNVWAPTRHLRARSPPRVC